MGNSEIFVTRPYIAPIMPMERAQRRMLDSSANPTFVNIMKKVNATVAIGAIRTACNGLAPKVKFNKTLKIG